MSSSTLLSVGTSERHVGRRIVDSVIFPSRRMLGLFLHVARTHVPMSTFSAPGSVNLVSRRCDVVAIVVAGSDVVVVAVFVVSLAASPPVAIVCLLDGICDVVGRTVVRVADVVAVGNVFVVGLAVGDRCLCAGQ